MTIPLFAPRRAQAEGSGQERALREVPQHDTAPERSYARDAAALFLLACALYASLALASYRADPMRPEVIGADWVGPVGATFARASVWAVGIVAWYVPAEVTLLAMQLLGSRRSGFTLSRLAGDVVVVALIAALTQIAFPHAAAFGAMHLSGAVGELFGEVLRALFSSIGSFIVGLTIIGLILLGRASFSVLDAARAVERGIVVIAGHVGRWFRTLMGAWSEARDLDLQEQGKSAEPVIATRDSADAIIAAIAEPNREPKGSSDINVEAWQAAFATADTPAAAPKLRKRKRAQGDEAKADEATAAVAAPEQITSNDEPMATVVTQLDASNVPTPSPIFPVQEVAPVERQGRAKPRTLKIVDTSRELEADKPDLISVAATPLGFKLPSTDMLDPPAGGRIVIDEAQLKHSAQLLEKTLADYGVSGRVEEIHPGPTVTTFEVSPAAGTKVSKVAGLADDLALGLSRKVRIIAPIPGKNRIGFEIPNDHRMPVNLRELVEDRRFLEMKAPLPCVLGRDIIGTPYFADLASMPHVIVAGATGAGKSVGLNVMLTSLLFRRTPSELRLLMVDPKVVELAPFDRIPHMLLPVVTDMKQAANALKWAVDEMERRYQLFAAAGTRNITTYNGWVERVQRGEVKRPKAPSKVSAIGPDGCAVEVDAAKDGSDASLPEKIPFIVIVVDEFADLMMQQGKDVEASVARLAQKARAAGMHVILATQRPSVDVITGMIKANFPTRIAFRVAQKVDSRTILDEQGAEHLLGRGDMLIKMNGATETRRVQCPFCSEEEVQRITDFLRTQGEPIYDEDILRPRNDDNEETAVEDAEGDPMYDAAVRIVAETRRCSTSWIQRKLGVGYNRAAKLVEAMEKRGLVGPANGAKDREVLVAPI